MCSRGNMVEENSLILHGIWSSPYLIRVKLALKVKGIDYEYVEQDLKNKSPELLRFNPVHKKVPVLVHNGKPIAESMLILEYIDETWKVGSPLLPKDPYERAQVRFWANFVHQQVFEAIYSVVKTEGEAQERAINDVHEKLKVLEEGIKNCSFSISRTGNHIGFLDIVMCSVFSVQGVREQVLGIKMLDPDKYPLISSWVWGLNELPLVKELLPPHEKFVVALESLRKIYLKQLDGSIYDAISMETMKN